MRVAQTSGERGSLQLREQPLGRLRSSRGRDVI